MFNFTYPFLNLFRPARNDLKESFHASFIEENIFCVVNLRYCGKMYIRHLFPTVDWW